MRHILLLTAFLLATISAIPADEKKVDSTASPFLDKDLTGWEGLIKE